MRGAFYIWQRDARLMFKFWVFFLVLLADLVFLLMAFGPAMTRLLPPLSFAGANFQIDYFTFFVPGLILLVVVQAGLYTGELSYVDRDMGILDLVLTSPLSRWSICLGKLAGITTLSTLIATLLYAAAFFLGFHPYDALRGSIVILGIIVIASWGFAGFSIATAMQVRDANRWMLIIGALLPPLTAAAALQYPVEFMPGWIQPIAALNPLTAAVTVARAATLDGQSPPPIALFGLFAFAVTGTVLANFSLNHPRLVGT